MEKDIKIQKEALRFAESNYIAVVATTFRQQPHASVVYYIVDRDFNFYFVTKRGTTKYKNLSIHNRASIVVTSNKQIYIEAKGRIDMVYGDDKEKIISNIKKILKKFKIEKSPLEKLLHLNDEKKPIHSAFALVRIVPKEITFMNLDDEKYMSTDNKLVMIYPNVKIK